VVVAESPQPAWRPQANTRARTCSGKHDGWWREKKRSALKTANSVSEQQTGKLFT